MYTLLILHFNLFWNHCTADLDFMGFWCYHKQGNYFSTKMTKKSKMKQRNRIC
jgi:hypothetical protein